MKKYLWGALILVVLLATASLAANAQATVRDLSGWAWSSNIGWVSFNSTDSGTGNGGTGVSPVAYKVQLDTDGDLTGYAWSSNVGWIKFDPSLTDAPGGATKASVNTATGQVSGYIRACTGTVNKDCASATRTDGWDGWISLSGTNHSSGDTSGAAGVTYAVSGNTATLKGYSWGSDVVGWLKFSPVTNVDTTVRPGSQNVSLTVHGTTVSNTTPGSVTLQSGSTGQVSTTASWSSSGYVSCSAGLSASGATVTGWSGASVGTSGTATVTFTGVLGGGSRGLLLTCLDSDDAVTTRTMNVTVDPYNPPALSCVMPSRAQTCTDNPPATFIYDSALLPAGTPSTTLLNSCPTSGTNYCVYVCQTGYEKNGNRCVISDLEEI